MNFIILMRGMHAHQFSYLIRFCFTCRAKESIFIPAASVKAPPKPRILWYVAVRFTVKRIPGGQKKRIGNAIFFFSRAYNSAR